MRTSLVVAPMVDGNRYPVAWMLLFRDWQWLVTEVDSARVALGIPSVFG